MRGSQVRFDIDIVHVSPSHLSVELDGGESLELVANQVCVMRGGDEVVRQWLVQVAPPAVLYWVVVLLLPQILLWRGEVQSGRTATQS